MALVVQKYGGTSVADAQRINAVARRVLERKKEGDQLVVVLSARAGETDRLIKLGSEITGCPDPREMDVLLATGEQTTIALFCMAVKAMGSEAVSMTGYQAGIMTDGQFGQARISWIQTQPIIEKLQEDKIVVVAGFQGFDDDGNITTLGGEGPILRRSRLLRRFMPPSARFTLTWKACSRRTPMFAPRRASWKR